MDESTVSDDLSGMLSALGADGPLPAWRAELALFGQFVGSWEVEGRFFEPDGSSGDEHWGEWHFGWVLEGRAIQDVLIRPARSRRAAGDSSDEYGTTLRVFDPRTRSWLVTWIAPVSGRIVNLVGRGHGDDILIEGPGPEGGLYRWTFSEIGIDRFVWQGYQSDDGGTNWFRGQEMIVRRTPPVTGHSISEHITSS